MSKSNSSPAYRDPVTSMGVRLAGEELFSFRLHEVGFRQLSKEWNYRGICSPYWRLYWASRPGAWIECAGDKFAIDPRRLLLIPAHVRFDTHGSPRPVRQFWIHFSLHPDLSPRRNAPLFAPCRQALFRQVEFLAQKVARPEPSDSRSFHHLCHALLHQVFAGPEVESRSPGLPAKLTTLLHEIESALAHPLSVTEMARRVGMSRGGFLRWFRHYLKVTPAHYHLRRRIDHACHQLRFSSNTIEEISENTGFANRGHFSRAFKRHTGSSPARFRKN